MLINVNYDSSFFGTAISTFKFSSISIYRNADKKDEKLFKHNKYFLNRLPNANNYDKYFQFACALWELEKLPEARIAFLNIFNSKESFYSDFYHHNSDIPGDTTTNTYGYGSYTSNYKNYAAKYLCKTLIEQKEFDSALFYLNAAVKNYPVQYNCGTGAMWQEAEYTGLYALCYQGLNRNQDIIELLLSKPDYWNDDILIRAIRNTYSKDSIQSYLSIAENSISCQLDATPTYNYGITNWGEKNEKTDTTTYYSGSATIKLFERELSMPVPRLENGEHMTKELFIQEFKASNFYIQLKEMAD